MQAAKRIICIGNRLTPVDSAGPETYDELCRRPIPPDVEVADGGLSGLAMLPLIDGSERVVFVDAILDAAAPEGVFLLDAATVCAQAEPVYGHGAGLDYLLHLLRLLPQVLTGDMPQLFVVGIAGIPHQDLITQAADLSLALAVDGVVPQSMALTGDAE